jgi:hypothetical protein
MPRSTAKPAIGSCERDIYRLKHGLCFMSSRRIRADNNDQPPCGSLPITAKLAMVSIAGRGHASTTINLPFCSHRRSREAGLQLLPRVRPLPGDACRLLQLSCPEFTTATNPNHTQAGFPRDCSVCHTTTTWTARVSTTILNLLCADWGACSAQLHFMPRVREVCGTPADCVGCHVALYEKRRTRITRAQTFQLPVKAAITSTWTGAKFDHNLARFPLTGAHTTLACAQCHVGGRFTGTPADCMSCHENAFRSTTNPNHVAAGFSTNCQACHTTEQWRGAKFEHNQTRFPLTGAHINVNCAQCAWVAFSPEPVRRVPVIVQRFRTLRIRTMQRRVSAVAVVIRPPHAGTKFDHSGTRFPLTGAHVNHVFAVHAGNVARNQRSASVAAVQHFRPLQSQPSAAASLQDRSAIPPPNEGAISATARQRSQRALVNVSCLRCHVNNRFVELLKTARAISPDRTTTEPRATSFPRTCETAMRPRGGGAV